jgi:soluble lytic murein transglycosylase-like protein
VACLRQAGTVAAALLLAGVTMQAHAAEHITLRNGFDLICDHREPSGDRVRLYLTATGPSFVEVDPASIVATEDVVLPAPPAAEAAQPAPPSPLPDIPTLLAKAGSAHDLDVELLASVIRAESGGNTHAVSRTGARGLMQLMPQTAAQLGVADSFRPDQNIDGGTAYLNALLLRYHDNLPLALAAYNAGPAAVDRYHGIPPYRETRAYVARIIRDYNRRKASAAGAARTLVASASPSGQ